MDIKVVDFSGIRTAANITPAVIDQLNMAFTTIGFVIITNHGIEEKVRVIHRDLPEDLPYETLVSYAYGVIIKGSSTCVAFQHTSVEGVVINSSALAIQQLY